MASQQKQEKASTFQPIHPFNMDQPKTWASTIGMMNWDNDKVVFSKRSLLEFLKSCDVTVDTNFSQIQKLPKYATFGHFSQAATDAAVADLVEAEIADPSAPTDLHPSKSTVPRPSNQAVGPNGGKQGLKIFPQEYEETDALSLAPPRDGESGVDVEVDRLEHMRLHVESQEDLGAKIEDEGNAAAQSGAYRPSIKVKPGARGTSMANILYGGQNEDTESARAGK